MIPLLRNPVYNSLLDNDSHLGTGSGTVKWFDEDVSPFAGFKDGYAEGFNELYDALPTGRRILYATPNKLTVPKKWKLAAAVEGLQFVFEGDNPPDQPGFAPTLLEPEHIPAMMELTALTKPGPFARCTIEFGHYYGVVENNRLMAMTGQRLHVKNFTEISAVCTRPDCLGRGYATALLQHQVGLILRSGQVPFVPIIKGRLSFTNG